MDRHRLQTRLALALALLAAGAGAPAEAQRAGRAPPWPAVAADEHSSIAAMGAIENYRTCNIRRGRAGTLQALAAELAAIESLARSKGLGPVLERAREEHRRILAVSSTMWVRCAGGPEAALAAARQALAAFRTWAERTPAHVLTRAEIDAEATREVLAADDAYAAAVTDRNEAAIRRILDERFVLDEGEGRTTDRDGLLALLGRMNLIQYRTTERTAAMGDGAATITGIIELASASASEPTISRFPSIATYRRRGGAWRMETLQVLWGPRP